MKPLGLLLLGCALSAALGLADPLVAQEPVLEDGELPVALLDATGGGVMAWVGVAETGRGIFARRIDSRGLVAGPDFRVDSGTATDAGNPSLAPLANGGFAGAWTAPDGDGVGLFLRRFDTTGAPLGAEEAVSPLRRGPQVGRIYPIVSGGFAAVWTTPGADGHGVRLVLRRYTAAGLPRGKVVLLRAFGTAETFQTATPGPGASLLVSWRIEPPVPCAWRAQRFGLDGRPLGAPFPICTFIWGYGASPPSIAAGRDGYVVVWEGPGSGIFGRRYALTGSPLGPAFHIDQPVSLVDHFSVRRPAVAAAPSGAFAVAWAVSGDRSTSRPGNGIMVRLYEPDGRPRTDQDRLGLSYLCPPGAARPSMSGGPDERVVVAWEHVCEGEAAVALAGIRDMAPPPPGSGWIAFAHPQVFGANEEDGFVTVELQRTGGTAGRLRVRFDTEPGTALPGEDYRPVRKLLVWEDGETAGKTVRIPLVADGPGEGVERFDVHLHLLDGDHLFPTAKVYIDSPGFLGFTTGEWEGPTEVWEGSRVPLEVRRYGGHRGAVGVGYTWSEPYGPGPAHGRLSWPDGDDRPRRFTVEVPDDIWVTGFWRGMFVDLEEPTGGAGIKTGRHWLAVQDDELSSRPGILRLEPSPPERPAVAREEAGMAMVQVRRQSGMGGPASVRWSTVAGTAAAGADFQPVSGILTWGASDLTVRTISIPLVADLAPEGDETFDVLLTDPRGAGLGMPARLQVTVRDGS